MFKVIDCERFERPANAGPLWVCETEVCGIKYCPIVELNGTDLDVNFCDNRELNEIQRQILWDSIRDYLLDTGCICMGEDGDYYDLNSRSYTIYQLPLSNKNIFNRRNFGPKEIDYVPVYCGYISDLKVKYKNDLQTCEELFRFFNHIDTVPKHFAGHGLSCSDVIVLTCENGIIHTTKAYLCVSSGFEDVTKIFFNYDGVTVN